MMMTRNERLDRKFSAGNILIPLLAVVLYFVIELIVFVAAILPRMMANHLVGLSPDAIQTNLLQSQTSQVLLVSAILHIIAFSLILVVSRKRGTPYIFHRLPQKQALILLPVLALGALGLSSLWMLACQSLASISPFFHRAIETYEDLIQTLQPQSQSDWLINILAVGVFVPIAEELLFRGVLLSEWKLCMPKSLAVLLSALLFSVFHGNWVQSGYTFFIGLLLGVLYLWTESIWYPIAMHMLFNLLGGSLADFLTRLGPDGAIWMLIFNLVQLVGFLFGVGGMVYLAIHRREARTVARGSVTAIQSPAPSAFPVDDPTDQSINLANDLSSKVG